MMNKIILAGIAILAVVSCHESQRALARISQIEQAIDLFNKNLATQHDNTNRHNTWPESITVGKQYTAYVGQDYGASFAPFKAVIKGSVEDGHFLPDDAKVGDCWFVKRENAYKVLIIQKIPPNTPVIPQTLQDGGYRLFAIVEGMSVSPVTFVSNSAPAPIE
jgi:hypothetical protein